MATITHFDISATNPDRAKKFYQSLFGWKIEMMPGPMNYYLIATTDLKGKKGIGGGMAKRERGQPEGIVNFMDVKSIDESLKKVKKLGGKIIQPKQAVPGWGYLAVCLDTEKNRFGIFEEDKKAF
jgi:uncharacterized protein